MVLEYKGYPIYEGELFEGVFHYATPNANLISQEEWRKALFNALELLMQIATESCGQKSPAPNPLKYVDGNGRVQQVGRQAWYDVPPVR
jgi:hypothetical protein